MALLLTVCWERSFIRDDCVFIPYRHSITCVSSCGGVVSWGRSAQNISCIPFMWQSIEVSESEDPEAHYDPWQCYSDIDWRRDWAGVSFGAGIQHGPEGTSWPFAMCVIPYWSLVLPLTLLSAWLILAKPRKAKAATGSTP